MLVLLFYQDDSFSLLLPRLNRGWPDSKRWTRSGRGRRWIHCRREDVDGRHGPLRLAYSVLSQPQARSPSVFVVSLASLHKLSWAKFFFALLKFIFEWSYTRFMSYDFIMFTSCDPSFKDVWNFDRVVWIMYEWVNEGVFVLPNLVFPCRKWHCIF